MTALPRISFATLIVLLTAGCSSDTMQRSGYEAVHGAALRDCRQYPSVECPRKDGYDDYQRQRKELQK
jgi:hypothetical protein